MVCPTLLPWGLRRGFGRRGRRGIAVGAQAESDQGEGVDLDWKSVGSGKSVDLGWRRIIEIQRRNERCIGVLEFRRVLFQSRGGFGGRGGREMAVGAQAESDQGEGVD